VKLSEIKVKCKKCGMSKYVSFRQITYDFYWNCDHCYEDHQAEDLEVVG